MAKKHRRLDEHKRLVKVRSCGDARAMTNNNGPARPISKKTSITKSKSAKIRGRSAGSKKIAAGSTVSPSNKQGTLNNAGRAGSSRQRSGSVKPSKRKAAASLSDSEISDDENWAVSDDEGDVLMEDEPRTTRKTRESLSQETNSLVTKMFDIRRETLTCPKPDCDAEVMLILNGCNHLGPMAKCNKCARKISGWQLANLLGITPHHPTTATEQPTEGPLQALKAANTALQKTNQEQAKKIENLQKTNTRMLNEMSLLRAQVSELTKLIKEKHSKGAPQQETVEVEEPVEMDTTEEVQETPFQTTEEPREARAPS